MSTTYCGCDPEAHHLCERHYYDTLHNALSCVSDPGDENDTLLLPPESVQPLQQEIRVTDPTTGGQKGSKLARFDLIPPEALWELAEHYGKGCFKYSDRNWERGYKWGLSVAALQRHLNAWLRNETTDPETGSHHLIAVMWHAIALYTYERRGLGTDDVRVK